MTIKGGILATSMVGVAMRSTMDIDASIKNLNLNAEDARMAVAEIAEIPLDDGVTFELNRVSDIMDNFEYPGVRLELNSLMGGMVSESVGSMFATKEKYKFNVSCKNR